MTDFSNLQIRTVYSAKEGEARPPSTSSGLRRQVLALLTFLIGLAWLYGTWVPAYNWINPRFMVGQLMLGAFGAQVNVPLAAPSAEGDAEAAPTPKPKPRSTNEREADTMQAQRRLAAITGGWLALSTLVGLWLIMSGSAALLTSRSLALFGMMLTPITIGLIVWIAFYVKREYAWYESLLPRWVYPTLGSLGVLAALAAGWVLQSWRIGLLRFGGVLVILSAGATVAGLWAALRYSGLPAEAFTTAFYVKAFAVQSAYGWVLLVGTIRLR